LQSTHSKRQRVNNADFPFTEPQLSAFFCAFFITNSVSTLREFLKRQGSSNIEAISREQSIDQMAKSTREGKSCRQ
jgi:hypothetical protein